jgi:hypothetical protein
MQSLKKRTPTKLKTAKNYFHKLMNVFKQDTLGNSGAYFLYDEILNKIILVLYIKIPNTTDYMVGLYGHKYIRDGRLTSSGLHEEYNRYVKGRLHYNMKDYTPTQLHDEFHKHKKLSKLYGVKWFQDKYNFVEQQLELARQR